MKFLKSFITPESPTTDPKNFSIVVMDGIGVGLASAAAPFLPVYLARLGASNLEVGLLTSMPAITGFFLAMVLGNYLQTRRNIIPWFAGSRFLGLFGYTLTGLITMVVSRQYAVTAILIIWAAATLPQTVIGITFSVVMNAVAGPTGRFELMSRRWSVLGIITALSIFLAGQALDSTWLNFPLNYEVVFIVLSLGAFYSFYYSSRIKLPENTDQSPTGQSVFKQLRETLHQVWQEKPFVHIVAKRFVYLTGITLGLPLFPLYYVHVVHASDAWIGVFSTVQTAVLVFGYFFWSRQTRRHGSRWILLLATLGMSLYPAVIALSQHEAIIAVISAASGIFQAGIDLVFFDELMKTVPSDFCPSFVSFDQSLQYLSAIGAPLLGTILADHIGIGGALIVSAAIRLAGFAWFALSKPEKAAEEIERNNSQVEYS